MAFDTALADRIARSLVDERGVDTKRMFGGIAFLVDEKMCVGVWKDELIVRVDPARHDDFVARPFARVFDVTGRPMKGWILVGQDALTSSRELAAWIAPALSWVRSGGAKSAKKARSSTTTRAGSKKTPAAKKKPSTTKRVKTAVPKKPR